MSPSWKAEEFRRVRIALVAASTLAWPIWLCVQLQDPFPWGILGAAFLAAAVPHFGLMLSLALERGDWSVRLFAAVMMIPNLVLVTLGSFVAVVTIRAGGNAVLAPFIPLAALHVGQLWRLTGVPFPRVHPISYLDPAPEPGAERTAAR